MANLDPWRREMIEQPRFWRLPFTWEWHLLSKTQRERENQLREYIHNSRVKRKMWWASCIEQSVCCSIPAETGELFRGWTEDRRTFAIFTGILSNNFGLSPSKKNVAGDLTPGPPTFQYLVPPLSMKQSADQCTSPRKRAAMLWHLPLFVKCVVYRGELTEGEGKEWILDTPLRSSTF